jgi:transcriptional regulator CtsR
MHTVNTIGDEIDLNSAAALTENLLQGGAIDKSAAQLLLAAIGNSALRPVPASARDVVRASIYKQMLVNIL